MVSHIGGRSEADLFRLNGIYSPEMLICICMENMCIKYNDIIVDDDVCINQYLTPVEGQ